MKICVYALALAVWGVLLVVSGPAHGFGHGVGVPAVGGTCDVTLTFDQ